MKKLILVFLMSLLAVFLFLNFAYPHLPISIDQFFQDSEKAPVRICLQQVKCNPGNLPLYVAIENGYFEKENIHIQINLSYIDDNVTNFDVILLGRNVLYSWPDQPGVLFAFTANYFDESNPTYAIIVQKDSEIKSLDQLKFKKIGLESGSGGARLVLMRIILERNGLDPNDSEINFFSSIEELENGTIDALYIREPEKSLALSKGNFEILVDEPVGRFVWTPWPMSYSAFSSEFLKERPNEAKKLVTVWDNAIDFIRKNPDEAGKLLEKCAQEEYGIGLKISQFKQWKLGEMDRTFIQKQIDLYHEKGILGDDIDVDDILYQN